jgi:DNA-directed RNA polymerase beta' subunit
LRNKIGSIKICPIGQFIEEQIQKSKKIDYMEDKDTTYAELDIEEEYYETPGANEAGETVWRRVEAVTQHPVINEDGTNTMLKVTTKGGREVTATKAKSFLQLIDGTIQGVNGKDLKVGDYLPVSIRPMEYAETFTLDLRKVLPPTEYIYGTEMEKASKVMHEHHWWKKHAGTTFVVPYRRSDSVVVAMQDRSNGRPRKVMYEPGMVYTKSNTICNYRIPEIMELDYDFGYLMGAYCAEGCTTKFQMSIANNDPAYFAPIIRVCEKYNLTYKMYKQENKIQEGWTSSDMRIYSSLLTRIVGELGGRLSHLKYVSQHIVFSNKQCIMGFLDAYIGGDGCVRQYRNTSGEQCPTSISVASTSHTMLTDVSVMLRNIGIASSIHKNTLKTSNNRGTLPENIHQGFELHIRNGQCNKLSSMLNLTIAHKQEKIQTLLHKPYKYEYSKFDDLCFPNTVDGEIVMEPRNDRMMDLQFDPIVSIEEVQNPTSYAYDLTVEDTRNFDLYNGLCVADTFHSSGIASKSNVTRGVPRIEEILRLTKNPKNPSMTVHLKPSDETDQDKINQFAILMGHTKLVDVVKSIQICFDPNPDATQISEDEPLLEQFYEFEKMVEDCMDMGTTTAQPNRSKWIIRMEMDQNSLMDKSITMDDIHFAISNSEYGKDVQCIFSDYNMDKLVFRIRTHASMFEKTTKKTRGVANPLDQSDDIYLLKNFQDTLLNNIVLRGVNGIANVLPRKIQNSMIKEDDKYVKKETWVLDTTGSNLLETLALDYIDSRRTYSNDIKEIFNVLGIEAARQCIHNELVEVMAFSGASINYHHTSLLCDRMTCNKNMVSIFRSGLLNDNVGPIAKATFEVHTEVFLSAARHAELDHMCGVSANIMCGQHGVYGTNACQIVLDMKAFEGVKGVPYKQTNTAVEIERGMTQGAETAATCSTTQIDIQNNIVNIRHTGEDVTTCYDDGYNVGF